MIVRCLFVSFLISRPSSPSSWSPPLSLKSIHPICLSIYLSTYTLSRTEYLLNTPPPPKSEPDRPINQNIHIYIPIYHHHQQISRSAGPVSSSSSSSSSFFGQFLFVRLFTLLFIFISFPPPPPFFFGSFFFLFVYFLVYI